MEIKKYTHKNPPRIISFLVTNQCVCRCKHCFNWFDTNPKGAIGNSRKKDLNVDEIKQIFYSLGPLDYLYLSGGEPFLRKDFCEILQGIYEFSKPKTINISTNGQLTDSTIVTIENFLECSSNVHLIVKVSIDGISDEHDKIRNTNGAFKQAIATYQSLMSLKNKYKNLKVGINTVFSAFNQDKIFEIYRYLSNLKPRPDCLAQLLVRDVPRDPDCKRDLKLNIYKEWTKLYAADMLKGKFETDISIKIGTIMMYDYIYRIITQNKRQSACYAGIAGAFIDNEGLIGACEHTESFGSLREHNYDFKKIWNSNQADKIRKEISNNCFCTNEPQWWHPTILSNKRIIKHSIRLAKNIISVLFNK
ncbi:MAG: radical SAM protein [Candidatus Omnitrophica bacterium]|nr:radical SAM protein [Candidatus Omnitrophota bacterium]